MKLSRPRAFPAASFALLATALLVSASTARAQGSDDCSSAPPIFGPGPFAFDNSVATSTTDGQMVGCGFGGLAVDQDVWFLWTASSSGSVLFSTCGQTFVDTKIAVYTSQPCSSSMFALACSDDDCNLQSQCLFTATSGQQYLIQVGCAPFSGGGTGTFTLDSTPPNTSDGCSAPVVISGNGTFPYDLTNATTSAQQPGSGCVTAGNDVWFRWTAPGTGVATLQTCGQTAVDTVIAVYAGGTCPTGHSIACDDDGCGTQSITTFNAVGGAQYMLQIGRAGGFGSGLGTMSIDVVGIPQNDSCLTPLDLGTGGGTSFDTSNATTGVEGQSNPCGAITNDLWYQWTAPSSGVATIETCFQTSIDTSIAVYPGTGCPTVAATACDDNACGVTSSVSIPVSVGSTWLIQVGDANGAFGGLGSFTITVGPPVMTPYCFGDGSAASCPCGNFGATGRGCANSVNASGALLQGSGTASVSSDSVVLMGSGMPNAAVLYLQGTARDNLGFGTTLFDGIRCVGGSVFRLATKVNSANQSQFPEAGDPSVSVRGGVPAAGGTFTYQCWYRNAAAAFCPPETANWTNGLEIPWAP